jgi:hypothetical protein
MMRLAIFMFFLGTSIPIYAQYAPAAGKEGSNALHKDSSIFISWAEKVSVLRGFLDIADTSLGRVTHGEEANAIGKADGAVISLGDGGEAIFTFDIPLANGKGPDFAIFENAFADEFLELAFVEVSSNGVDFVRFPSHSLTQTNMQVGGFDKLQPENLNNLAGKFRVFYGTPFDLEELDTFSILDINSITHIKVKDVIGTIDSNFAQKDASMNIVNDPYPTAFESGGFDLDALGIIYNRENYLGNQEPNKELIWIKSQNPLPLSEELIIEFKHASDFLVMDYNGKILYQNTSPANTLRFTFDQKGVYFIKWTNVSGTGVYKLNVLD